jgi:hypothetical protein
MGKAQAPPPERAKVSTQGSSQGELLFPVLVKRARLFPQMNPVQRNNFPSIDASRRGKINGGAAIIFS